MLKIDICNDKIYMDKLYMYKSEGEKMKETENFEQNDAKEALTSNRINSFLDKLKEIIRKNKELINDANKIDLSHNKKQIKLKEFENIIESYKNTEILTEKESKRKIVIYKGDPYLTLHICLQAVIQNTKLVIINQQFMNGVNSVVIGIFDKLLDEFGVSNLIDSFNEFSINHYSEIKKYYDETIVIGDSCVYQLLSKTEKNVRFYPYNNIAVYCEDDKLKQLEEAIFIYANENQYEIEVVGADALEEAIERINKDEFKSIAVLITQSNENRERFFYEIKNKEIFVNENPFKKDVGKVYNYLK